MNSPSLYYVYSIIKSAPDVKSGIYRAVVSCQWAVVSGQWAAIGASPERGGGAKRRWGFISSQLSVNRASPERGGGAKRRRGFISGQRFARDIKTGKRFEVPRDMTYNEWKAKQGELYGEGAVDKARKMHYNESADRKQWKKYRELLGSDAPKTFTDFQELKYDDDDAYQELCGLYTYKGRVPEATAADYKAYKAIKATGVAGSVRVPPKPSDPDALFFKDEHATHHGCTIDDARAFIKDAKCSITRKRWDGYHTNYYSLNGATYVSDDEGVINTAFGKKDFDPLTQSILEVFQ